MNSVTVVGASESRSNSRQSKAVLCMRIPNNVLCLWYAKMQMDAADPDYITLLNDSVDKSLIQISQSAHRLFDLRLPE